MVFFGVTVGAHQFHSPVTDHFRDIAGIDLGSARFFHQIRIAEFAALVEHRRNAQLKSAGARFNHGLQVNNAFQQMLKCCLAMKINETNILEKVENTLKACLQLVPFLEIEPQERDFPNFHNLMWPQQY
jgi:hypothetical protein